MLSKNSFVNAIRSLLLEKIRAHNGILQETSVGCPLRANWE
jgi:hypothetical protein